MSNFVIAVAHEYVHFYQKANFPGMDQPEREFLANSFSVFPNTSMMRSLMPDWKVELPEATQDQRLLNAATALKKYDLLDPGLKAKYKDEYLRVKACYENLKSQTDTGTNEDKKPDDNSKKPDDGKSDDKGKGSEDKKSDNKGSNGNSQKPTDNHGK